MFRRVSTGLVLFSLVMARQGLFNFQANNSGRFSFGSVRHRYGVAGYVCVWFVKVWMSEWGFENTNEAWYVGSGCVAECSGLLRHVGFGYVAARQVTVSLALLKVGFVRVRVLTSKQTNELSYVVSCFGLV